MEPRLKSSIKWTPFPVELVAQIKEVMTESFEDYDTGGEFVVDGAIYPEELILRIGLAKPNQLRQDTFEASIQYNPDTDKTTDKIHVLVDFLGQVWETFIEDEPEREDLSVLWTPEQFEKNTIFLKYSSANTNLEKQADELLALYEKKLVHEIVEEDPEEVFARAQDARSDADENPYH